MQEVEVKYQVPNHKAILETLLAKECKPLHTEVQEDTHYTDGEQYLRIRKVEGGGYEATLKEAAVFEGGCKQRREINVALLDNPEELLAALKFKPVLQYRKIRITYQIDEVLVCLDWLPKVGYFVELEILTENPTEAQTKIKEVTKQLKLQDAEICRDGYAALMGLNKTTDKAL